jgi:hypothetical protein
MSSSELPGEWGGGGGAGRSEVKKGGAAVEKDGGDRDLGRRALGGARESAHRSHAPPWNRKKGRYKVYAKNTGHFTGENVCTACYYRLYRLYIDSDLVHLVDPDSAHRGAPAITITITGSIGMRPCIQLKGRK